MTTFLPSKFRSDGNPLRMVMMPLPLLSSSILTTLRVSGVMEAALRTAYEVVTGKEIPFDGLNVTPVRGMEGIKEAAITMPEKMSHGYEFLAGATLKVAVANGLTNAGMLMDKVRSGEADYHFIEIMACPGGCLGGGGQPIPTSPVIRQKRAEAIYAEDAALHYRKSHANPETAPLRGVPGEAPGAQVPQAAPHPLHREGLTAAIEERWGRLTAPPFSCRQVDRMHNVLDIWTTKC